jgi:hypothetical protein
MHRRTGAFAAAALLCALVAARASGDVIYVRAGATGSNNGSTWSNAFTSLQSGLALASSGDQIWVAAGTYKPSAAADRGLSFVLVDGVAIYGGFAGSEATLGERDPAVNLTALSGDIGAAGNPTDNSYHVVRAGATVTSSAVLDGFTVSGGRADGAFPDNRGGGISCEGGSPTFSLLILSGNHAADRGGAARVDSGSPSFSDCTFLSNSAGSFGGGGLSAGVVGTLVVSRCRFQGNTVGNSTGGGAIHTSNATVVSNSLITGNSPHAIVFAQQGNSLTNCTVAGNSGYGVTFVDVNNTVRNSILYGNSLGEVNPCRRGHHLRVRWR